MVVTEIFKSIQGEGTRAGLPCIFVRLTGCHLRCAWCDTVYAFHGGRRCSLDEVLETVRVFARTGASRIPLVEPHRRRIAAASGNSRACREAALSRRMVPAIPAAAPRTIGHSPRPFAVDPSRTA